MKSKRHQQGENMAMLRKQHEVMIHVLANLVATQLQKSSWTFPAREPSFLADNALNHI